MLGCCSAGTAEYMTFRANAPVNYPEYYEYYAVLAEEDRGVRNSPT